MRVNELVRQTVVYVGHEPNGTFVPLGTGFMCSLRDDETGNEFNFVATVQHVIDDIPGIKEEEPDARVSIRVNCKSGGCDVVKCENMIFRTRETVDVALVPVDIGSDIYDFMCLSLDRKEQEDLRELWPIGIGDEVCVSGIYTSHYGEAKNIPIVRLGHLAAMPEELVRIGKGFVEGYLIEVHSIGGLSGSPVFVTLPTVFWDENKGSQIVKEPSHVPVGMLLGHHVLESREDEILIPEYQPASTEEVSVFSQKNTGIAVVVPMERIIEIGESEPMRKLIADSIERDQEKT